MDKPILRPRAFREAQQAGLDDVTADAVASRVMETLIAEGWTRLPTEERVKEVIAAEIQKHAQP